MAITKIDSSMLEDVSGADNLVKLDANAKIPAGTGANLLNRPGPFSSASDPTKTSNKAAGTEWLNTTSGEMYVCTNATTDSNIWTNVGDGSGNVQPWEFQGTAYGYTSGGHFGSQKDVIDKFSFTSDGNATDVGNLTFARTEGCGHSSATYGYVSGGRGVPYATLNNSIDKFSFASDANATDSGDLVATITQPAGQSSTTHGYVAGGLGGSAVASVQKFSTSSGGNASAISGVLTSARRGCAGVSSPTYGYTVGGSGPYSNVIEKMNFSTDANATDVGDLSIARGSFAGNSSTTEGFAGGGADAGTPPGANQIEKWSFASDANATSHGNLSREAYGVCGQSATAYGYTSGGYVPNTYSNIIDKYAFTSNTTATDVGDLSVARGELPQAQQY